MHHHLRFAFCLILLTTAPPAFGGNYRAFLMADEAAMTGGAGIAVSRDSGSLWYNPAGLGGLKLGRMELTGTVYSLKVRPMRKMLETRLPSGAHTKDGKSNDFQPIPTSVVFVRNMSDKLSYGFAIYQRNNSSIDYRLSLNVPYDNNGAVWSEGFEYHQQAAVYDVGPAIGLQINPRFRIGCALYLEYLSSQVSLRGFAGIRDDSGQGTDMLVSISEQGAIMRLGLSMTAGIQWEFIRDWHVGLVLRTPMFQVLLSSDISSLESEALVVGSNGSLSFDYSENSKNDTGFTQVHPFEAQLGLVYKRGGSWIGIEGAMRPPLEKQDMGLLWNVSVGGRLKISDVFSWGAGFFTDRRATKLSDMILDWESDRYGVTTGLEFKTPVLVKKILTENKREENDSDKQPPGDSGETEEKELKKLVWATTVAIGYAFELAEYNSLYIDNRGEMIIEPRKKTGVFHQPTIYMGTALYF